MGGDVAGTGGRRERETRREATLSIRGQFNNWAERRVSRVTYGNEIPAEQISSVMKVWSIGMGVTAEDDHNLPLPFIQKMPDGGGFIEAYWAARAKHALKKLYCPQLEESHA